MFTNTNYKHAIIRKISTLFWYLYDKINIPFAFNISWQIFTFAKKIAHVWDYEILEKSEMILILLLISFDVPCWIVNDNDINVIWQDRQDMINSDCLCMLLTDYTWNLPRYIMKLEWILPLLMKLLLGVIYTLVVTITNNKMTKIDLNPQISRRRD